MIPKIVFCPKCRIKIKVPPMITDGNIIVQAGFITLECGNTISFNGGKKLVKCTGKVKIKNNVMGKEEMINAILKDYPGYDIMDRKIMTTFGQYISGVGDTWSWFTRTGDFPEKLKDPEHRFLEDANEDQLKEILALLKTGPTEEETNKSIADVMAKELYKWFKEFGLEKMNGNGAEVYAKELDNNTLLVLTKDSEGYWYYSDDGKKIIVKDYKELISLLKTDKQEA